MSGATTKSNPGRPPHQPTDEQRRWVQESSGLGMPQEAIARVIGVSGPTLRKHYRDELDDGVAQANRSVAQSLYMRATGDGRDAVPACIFWLKTRARWREDVVTAKELEEKMLAIVRVVSENTEGEAKDRALRGIDAIMGAG